MLKTLLPSLPLGIMNQLLQNKHFAESVFWHCTCCSRTGITVTDMVHGDAREGRTGLIGQCSELLGRCQMSKSARHGGTAHQCVEQDTWKTLVKEKWVAWVNEGFPACSCAGMVACCDAPVGPHGWFLIPISCATLEIVKHSSIQTYDTYDIFESHVHIIRVWYLSYVWNVKHTLPFLDSIKYSVKLSNVQEEQKPIITSQNASYTGQTHSRRRKCKNHRNSTTLQIVRYQIRTHWCHVVL